MNKSGRPENPREQIEIKTGEARVDRANLLHRVITTYEGKLMSRVWIVFIIIGRSGFLGYYFLTI